MQKLFLNKMLQKLKKNISTDGKVMSKIKWLSFSVSETQCIVMPA